MSLIGDALRKARQEASERESDRKGILFSAKIADSPGRSNLGLGLALGALIAVIATVAGGAAVWWVLGGADTDEPPMIEATQSGSVDPVNEKSDPVPDPEGTDISGSGRDGGSASGSEQDRGRRSVTESPAAVDPVPVPHGTGTSDDSSGSGGGGDRAEDEVQSPIIEVSESGYIGTQDGEEIYILEANLGNGVSLSLDFLIFREEDPFAEINGIELHLGGTIEGFRVKDIARDRVTLSNGRRTIVLRAP